MAAFTSSPSRWASLAPSSRSRDGDEPGTRQPDLRGRLCLLPAMGGAPAPLRRPRAGLVHPCATRFDRVPRAPGRLERGWTFLGSARDPGSAVLWSSALAGALVLGVASNRRSQARNPPGNLTAVGHVLRAERLAQRGLLVEDHEEVKGERDDGCVDQHARAGEEESLPEDDGHGAEVGRIAHVSERSADDEAPGWGERCRRPVPLAHEAHQEVEERWNGHDHERAANPSRRNPAEERRADPPRRYGASTITAAAKRGARVIVPITASQGGLSASRRVSPDMSSFSYHHPRCDNTPPLLSDQRQAPHWSGVESMGTPVISDSVRASLL